MFVGVMVGSPDELTVQSLLSLPESSAMGLSGELMAQTTFIQGPPSMYSTFCVLNSEDVSTYDIFFPIISAEITLDEDDVFQCGKCKKVFTSFQLFMLHKKKHQLPGRLNFADCLDWKTDLVK